MGFKVPDPNPVILDAVNYAFFTVSITTSKQLIAPNAYRIWCSIVNVGGEDMTISPGNDAAVAYRGIEIKANGGAVVFDKSMPWRGAIQCIGTGAAQTTAMVCEVEIKH